MQTDENPNVLRQRIESLIRLNDYDSLVNMIVNSPKLRSPAMGYTTEQLFEQRVIRPNPEFTEVFKPSDDGEDSKVDLFFNYGNRRYRAQVKSIYTGTLKPPKNGVQVGSVGITNNSKEYVFEEGAVRFKTKCPPRLDYDILVASMYVVTGNPDDFIYMPSYYMGYPTAQSPIPIQYRHYFAGSAEKFIWPLLPGSRWTTNLLSLLDNRLGLPLLAN